MSAFGKGMIKRMHELAYLAGEVSITCSTSRGGYSLAVSTPNADLTNLNWLITTLGTCINVFFCCFEQFCKQKYDKGLSGTRVCCEEQVEGLVLEWSILSTIQKT